MGKRQTSKEEKKCLGTGDDGSGVVGIELRRRRIALRRVRIRVFSGHGSMPVGV